MSFTGGLQQFARSVPTRADAVFVGTAVAMRDGIKFGSAVSRAPSMPVAPGRFPRAGKLRADVTLTFPDPQTALLYTTSPYALDVEDNVKGHTFNEGGPHGWKLTVAAFPRQVELVAQRIAGAAP
jgi:hypothetical protein